jgi:hypothetical protein
MMRRDNLVKVNEDKILIYSRIAETKTRANKDKRRVVRTPKLVFSGTEAEAVFFIMNNNINFNDYTIYLPEKIYRKVVR